MEKKFKLTEETKVYDGRTLYRIEALKDFGTVNKGDKGGFVEKEENLSQFGDCWIFGDSCVFDNAVVSDSARIIGHARVFGNARVYGYSFITDYSFVSDNARVCDVFMDFHSFITDYAIVIGNVVLSDKSFIRGSVKVIAGACDLIRLFDDSSISGNGIFSGSLILYLGRKLVLKNR